MVLPFVALWVEAGLDGIGMGVLEEQKLQARYLRNEKVIESESAQISVSLIKFSPMQITSLKPSLNILFVFLGVTMGALVMEMVARNMEHLAEISNACFKHKTKVIRKFSAIRF